jgi:hypothetical protein
MKCLPAMAAMAVMSLVSCDTMTGPITTGDFDPLRPPGGNIAKVTPENSSFIAGQFVRAAMNNTAFFKSRPNGDADADKLLKQDTSMKVVSTMGSYLKVELDSGEVGYVPSVMVEDPKRAQVPIVPVGGEYPIYPPVQTGIGEPLPVIDPASQPPDGAIPTVIDPDAPKNPAPVAPASAVKDQFAAPVEHAPLPPNSDDIEAMKKAKAAEAAKSKP